MLIQCAPIFRTCVCTMPLLAELQARTDDGSLQIRQEEEKLSKE